jgi:putative peptidoglycan lipid II flippase
LACCQNCDEGRKGQLKASLESRWRQWFDATVNRRIFAASLVVGALGALGSLIALVKELVVARQFGRGDEIDAFLIAFLLPAFAINVVAASLNTALVPTVVQVSLRDGEEAGARLFSSAVVTAAGLLVAVSVLLAALFPLLLPILASNFDPDKRALTLALFHAVLPAVTISGIATVWAGMLNARQRFAAAAVAPLLVPALTIVFLLLGSRALGAFALATGTVAGMFAQCALLAAALRKQGLPVFPRWHGLSDPLRQVVGQYLPMVAGAMLMSGAVLVDQAMAAMLDPGSVAALGYGSKLVAAAVTLGSQALGTAVLPHFSQMVASGDHSGLRHSLATWTRIVVVVSAAATVALMLLSEPLIRVMFERGAFTSEDTRVVSEVQTLYALQIPFHVLGMLYVRVISAFRQNRVLLWGATISLPLNAILNYVLMWRLGVAGIAVSTSIVYAVSCAFLGWHAIRALR